jgi:hypothetical protein
VQIKSDGSSAAKMSAAADRDTAAMQEHIDKAHPECSKAYSDAAKKIKENDNEKMVNDAIDECCPGA